VGLVGGMGSGKSRVAALLAGHGARVIDGDALAHEALRQAEVKRRVVERWGAGVLDEGGEVNRRRLGAIVFADPAERRALEELVHPWIKRRVREQAAAYRADPSVPLIVLDAAVMLEAGWSDVCDRLVFVDAPPEVRLGRLRKGRGWTADELAAREGAQIPLAEKAARADHRLDNSGSLETLERNVEELLRLWEVLPAPRPG
jgi:dephospho-CoA kinase